MIRLAGMIVYFALMIAIGIFAALFTSPKYKGH